MCIRNLYTRYMQSSNMSAYVISSIVLIQNIVF